MHVLQRTGYALSLVGACLLIAAAFTMAFPPIEGFESLAYGVLVASIAVTLTGVLMTVHGPGNTFMGGKP